MHKWMMKEFMVELSHRLGKLTHEQLKEILLEQAKTLPPKDRGYFLDRFVPPVESKKEKKTGKRTRTEGDYLLEEINAFGKRAENYESSNGWGWDEEYGDERAWGDDSWVSEIEDLFDQTEEFYETGEYEVAREAYEALLEIYQGGTEEGRFSGYDHDQMIGADIDEVTHKYLRCVYYTEEVASRPHALFNAISRVTFHATEVSINGMINVSTEDLPGLDQFGEQWIGYLKKQKENALTTNLLKEAVRLFQGAKGLEALAMENSGRYPGAFVEWLEVLKQEGKHEAMIGAAKIGLEKLPDRLTIRAKIAGYLYDAATHMKKKDLVDESRKEGLYASPSLERLLDLLDCAKDAEERTKLIDGALSRFDEIKQRSKRSTRSPLDFDMSLDLRENCVPEVLEVQAHLLNGEYSKVVSLAKGTQPLGWTSGDNPNSLAVPFFLYARWNKEKALLANIAAVWRSATTMGMLDYEDGAGWEKIAKGDEEKESRFRMYLERVTKDYPIPEEDLSVYFRFAEKAALKRIDSIVAEKHRKSYWKGAQLLLALAEVYWSNDQIGKGQSLIDLFIEKYNRHSAFRSELREKAKRSGCFSAK